MYSCFYINLDESVDRKSEMEAEFFRLKLSARYARFAAAKGNKFRFPNPSLSESEIGCFTSHCLVLKDNIDSRKHLHIVEDDVVMCPSTEYVIRWAIESGTIEQYDILFTDTFVAPINREYQQLKSIYDQSINRDAFGAVTMIWPHIIAFQAGMNSYLVNRNSIRKLIDLYMGRLGAGTKYPVDLAVKEMTQGALRTGTLFPFTTSVRLARIVSTTMVGRQQHDLTATAGWLGRHSFFVGSDAKALKSEAERLLSIPADDQHHQLLSHILSFSLTDKYRPY
jgi:GR25 family glycosyltransferase involved in LPS biosynthesis